MHVKDLPAFLIHEFKRSLPVLSLLTLSQLSSQSSLPHLPKRCQQKACCSDRSFMGAFVWLLPSAQELQGRE